MKTRILTLAAAALAGSAVVSSAALTALDSAAFVNKYNGDQIFDGTTTINGWAANGGATDADLSTVGSNLILSLTNPANNNGWIEHDGGSTPWEAGSGSWTVEVRANVSANAGNGGFVIWGALNGERDILVVRENSVTGLAGADFDTSVNVGSFHDYRLTFDGDENSYHYFRDGVELTPAGGVPRQDTTPNTRLIVGDCCTDIGGPGETFGGAGTTVEIEYVRYDNTGAFSPAGAAVPEPSSALLVCLASLSLLLRRQRR